MERSNTQKKEAQPTYIGGQAAMEGVMMRGKTLYALAVRTPDGGISLSNTALKAQKNKLLKLPVIRGVLAFVNSMALGVKIIYDSAEKAGLDDLQEENPSKFDLWLEKKLGDKLFNYMMMLSVVIAIVLGVGIFMLLPVFIASLINPLFGGNTTILAVLEGLLRIIIFLLYMFLISKVKDVQRVFQYHGAEHKTISCFESGDELIPKNAAKHSRLHKRCRTSFMLIVMLVSMVFFMFFRISDVWLRVGTRILFVPVIAGLSYEIIMWAGRSDNLLVRALSYPGMLLQKWTTREPDEAQLEIAIAAMKAVLYEEPPEMTIAEALEQSAARLAAFDTASLDASLIVSEATGFSASELISKGGEKLPKNAYRVIDELCVSRKSGMPMAYILGEQGFMEHSFKVNKNVLIPRPDTETLVEAAYRAIREKGIDRVLELGTGSGCIALSIAAKFPEIQVLATDISPGALDVARGQMPELAKLRFAQGDLFDAVGEGESFGLIVSNPPYIKSGDIAALDACVRDFEPHSALDGGADGLDFYRRISSGAHEYLEESGTLMLEIGFDQAHEVLEILKENGFDNLSILKDLAGHNRVVVGIRSIQ